MSKKPPALQISLAFCAPTSHFLAAIDMCFPLKPQNQQNPYNPMPVTTAELVHLRRPRPGKFLHQKLPLFLLMPTGHVEFLNLFHCASYTPSILLTCQKIFQGLPVVKQCFELHILWSLHCSAL